MSDLLLGGVIGALLFGGSSRTTVIKQESAKESPISNVTPVVIEVNKKERTVIVTCPECGGAGTKEYSFSNFSSSVSHERGTFVRRATCYTCEGKKLLKIDISKEIWEKAKKSTLKK